MALAEPIHLMDDEKWLQFFRTCAETIDVKPVGWGRVPVEHGSWCAWTTFDRLGYGIGYWSGPLPTREELAPSYLGHGENWSQYFHYSQLCHLIVPRTFAWERAGPGHFERGDVTQDLDAIASVLLALDIPHRLTSIVLEIKTY